MKILNKINLYKFFLIILALFIFIIISAMSYVNAISLNLSNNIFRLHVVANSDSEEDQNLKYLVRDNIISYMNSICNNITDKKEVIKVVNEHKQDFYDIAKQTIISNGYNYDINIDIGNFYFPTKQYGDISFPCGNYDGLKIEIGEAEGENWWCVMFPPLCFIDVTNGVLPEDSKDIIEDNLSSEEYILISNNNDFDIKFKFKLVEFFNKF